MGDEWPAYMNRSTLARYLDVPEVSISAMVEDGRVPPPIVLFGRTERWKFADVKKPDPPSSFVYFIECGDFIKIGFSNDAPRRIKSIADVIPIPVVTLLIARGTLSFEAELHARFAEIRHRGEWFKKHPKLLAFIEELRAQAA